jgi:hypothetical protein
VNNIEEKQTAAGLAGLSYAYVEEGGLPPPWTYALMEDVAEIVAGVGFPKHLQGKTSAMSLFSKSVIFQQHGKTGAR